ncbi:hypothetical protein VTI74DRAFT_8836 [Chaetomium olivicolor]
MKLIVDVSGSCRRYSGHLIACSESNHLVSARLLLRGRIVGMDLTTSTLRRVSTRLPLTKNLALVAKRSPLSEKNACDATARRSEASRAGLRFELVLSTWWQESPRCCSRSLSKAEGGKEATMIAVTHGARPDSCSIGTTPHRWACHRHHHTTSASSAIQLTEARSYDRRSGVGLTDRPFFSF